MKNIIISVIYHPGIRYWILAVVVSIGPFFYIGQGMFDTPIQLMPQAFSEEEHSHSEGAESAHDHDHEESEPVLTATPSDVDHAHLHADEADHSDADHAHPSAGEADHSDADHAHPPTGEADHSDTDHAHPHADEAEHSDADHAAETDHPHSTTSSSDAHSHEGEPEPGAVVLPSSLRQSLGVQTVPVEKGEMVHGISLYGWIRPRPEDVTEIKAALVCMVEEVHVQPGEVVRNGSPLVTLRIPECLAWQKTILTSLEELDCMEASQHYLSLEGKAAVVKVLGELHVALAERVRLNNEVLLIEQAGVQAVSKRELNTKMGELAVANAELHAKRALAQAYGIPLNTITTVESSTGEIVAPKDALPPEIHRQLIHTEDRQHDLETEIVVATRNLESIGFTTEFVAELLKGNRKVLTDTLTLKAVSEGVVIKSEAHLRDVLEVGAPLFEIINYQKTWIEVEVPEVDVDQVLKRAGDKVMVEVIALGNQILSATVDHFDTAIDSDVRKAHLVLECENLPGLPLKDNMAVTANIPLAIKQDALIIPKKSVLTDGFEKVVIVEEEPGHFHRINVQTGLENLNTLEIVSGLEEGNQVVTTAARALLLGIATPPGGGADAHAGHGH